MPALWITDCQPATTADIERGTAAALEVLSAAGYTADQAHRADMLAADDEPHDEAAAAAWRAAERAGIAACCTGWQRIPDSACLSLE